MSNILKSMAVALAAALLAGCVDDNYDLSNVDTTVKVPVDNLIVPINIEEITLDDILELKDTDSVKVINGEYAVLARGTFKSDDISVPAITLKAPTIQSSVTPINLTTLMTSTRALPTEFSYNMANETSPFEFTANAVSDFIVEIGHLGCELSLTIKIQLQGLENAVKRVSFKNVVLQLPTGLDLVPTGGADYKPATGLLTIPDQTITGTSLTLTLNATGVNFPQAGGVYKYDEGTISLKGSLFIKQGTANIQLSDINTGITSLPAVVNLVTDYTLSDAKVTTFSGKVKYDISGAHLADIDLSSLPDVLSQNATNLTFVNPMLYLEVDNPLQQYKLYARTGFDITAYHGTDPTVYSLDNTQFQIGPDNASGIYNYVLSPTEPTIAEPAFPDAVHVPFTTMGNVLSGDGIPQRLSLDLNNPGVPAQPVTNLAIGKSLGSLTGRYRFVAPLQFGAGSTITYKDKIDGWSSDDLDHVTVTALEVNLEISTDIPVAVDFKGYPIDAAGNQIGNVEIIGAEVNANADHQVVTMRITGEIRGLDGIEFVATAISHGGAALSPGMKVHLTKIRPCVTGYYEKEL